MPTPTQAQTAYTLPALTILASRSTMDAYRDIVCASDHYLVAHRVDAEKAEAIVTACNSYERTRAENKALRKALAELVQEADQTGGRERTVSRYAVDKARAALSGGGK